jgi:trk system potassium uptake protein TrkA
MDFKGGKAELAEVTLAPNSPACDKTLKDLKFPRSATVVAVVRDEVVLVPESDTILRAGDEVMVLITEDAEVAIQKILIG